MHSSPIIPTLFAVLNDAANIVWPPLLAATVIAFLVALFQAVTQTQEQTLPQTVKIVVIAAVLLAFAGQLVSPLFRTTEEIFSTFYLKH